MQGGGCNKSQIQIQDYRFYRNDTDFDMPAECREHGDWRRVYREGCDSKYGTIMVSHEMRA